MGYIVVIAIFSCCISYITIKRLIVVYMSIYINYPSNISIIIFVSNILFVKTLVYRFFQL